MKKTRKTSLQTFVPGALVLVLASALVSAEALVINDPMPSEVDFQLIDPPVMAPRVAPEGTRQSGLSSTTVVALDDGALVLDSDSGDLLRLSDMDRVLDRLHIEPYAAHIAFDAATSRAYVSDRMGDRIVVVSVSRTLREERSFATRAEPYGLALTPAMPSAMPSGDGAATSPRLLLVTTVADRQLSAYRPETGEELWSIEIGPEPRGIAIAPDGERAIVTSIQSAAVARLVLRHEKPPLVRFVSLDRQHPVTANGSSVFVESASAQAAPLGHSNAGRAVARSAFAATYLRGGVAVIPHQESKPHQNVTTEDTGVYGGGGEGPVTHRLSFIADRGNAMSHEGRVGQAATGLHQPRALVYSEKDDILYVAAFGSDEILALADASSPAIHSAWRQPIAPGCGPDGMALNQRGELLVFCSLTRTLATVTRPAGENTTRVVQSRELSKSRLSAPAQRGRALFRQGGNSATSRMGQLACTSCHPEGRTDGLSWRIQGQNLQTPLLAGRIVGTEPFKWDAGDRTIDVSLRHTVTRLGGDGISDAQTRDLQSFVESMPRPRAPRVSDTRAVARGKALFESDRTGCTDCHRGKMLTDQRNYGLAADLERVDTPSLIGVAVSAPYYHDGSAASLRAVLMENGTIHGMGNTESLRQREIADLIAYLQTL